MVGGNAPRALVPPIPETYAGLTPGVHSLTHVTSALPDVCRYITDPRHTAVLSGVVHRVLDTYATVVHADKQVERRAGGWGRTERDLGGGEEGGRRGG
jgi:hypothetical protein